MKNIYIYIYIYIYIFRLWCLVVVMNEISSEVYRGSWMVVRDGGGSGNERW